MVNRKSTITRCIPKLSIGFYMLSPSDTYFPAVLCTPLAQRNHVRHGYPLVYKLIR
jgi:hypothetical protein